MGRYLTALVVTFSLLACGGHSQGDPPDTGTTSVQGSVNGVTLTEATAVAIPDNSNATGGPTNEYTRLTLGIANQALTCTTGSLPNGTLIGITITVPGTAPVGPGSYTVNNDQTSALENIAALVTTDGSCAETAPATCIGGTITIDLVSDGAISGKFTLAFDSGEALHGTFSASVCTTVPAPVRGGGC